MPRPTSLGLLAVGLLCWGGVCPVPAARAAEPAPVAPTPAAPAEVADNQVAPVADADLQERARGLFEAIVRGEPASAEPFWFPKPPFEKLKDIPEPGKYWEQLHRAYLRDVKVQHEKRKTWESAKFVRFELTRPAKWVAPGKEGNKIGYYRSLHGRLLYELDEKTREIDVHTVITWQGRWHVTHLDPFK